MASFYSEKSLVKKKRRKANGVNRSRIQREQRERERIRREKEELLKLKRYNAATTISSTFRRYKSNLVKGFNNLIYIFYFLSEFTAFVELRHYSIDFLL